MTPSQFINSKKQLPTDLRTRELSRLPLWVKEQAFFMAGVTNAVVLGAFREAAQAVVDGRMSEAEATRGIREALARTGYQPGDGQEGTIKDLSTLRRQMVTLRTNVALARGYGAEVKQVAARAIFPAKELYRASASRAPRMWPRMWAEAVARRNAERPDLPPLSADTMMAPLGDRIWVMLSDFGAPYDPLKYGSRMRQRPVGKRAAREAGILPPEDGNETDFVTTVRSPGEAMVVRPALPDAGAKREVERALKGLGEWQGEDLIFTDPNGTRPAGPAALARVIGRPNVDGTRNYQERALARWLELGGDEEALAEMRRVHAGEDMLDDFNRLVDRMQRAEPGAAIVDLLGALAEMLKG